MVVLIVLPFFTGDAALAHELLVWIKQLGGCPDHNLLLVADAATQWNTVLDMIAEGNKSFRNTGIITTKESVSGWPKGSNSLFKLAAQHCKEHRTSFLWLEPDAVPMRQGWLQEIQKAYNSKTKPFMGRIYSSTDPGMPGKLMSGIAVYPENTIDLIGNACDGDKAWDVAIADTVVPQCENTKLIHHFWGQVNLPPTFVSIRTKSSPINAFTMENVDAQAAIFHRVKEGSLIRLLRKRLFPNVAETHPRKFDVVFPFCATDADLALENMKWMAELNSHYDYTIILAIDDESRLVNEILGVARSTFEQVIVFKYPLPPVPGHPQAANWAFKHIARYMQERGRSWLWMEPDFIPLKPEWLDALQQEYDRCGMPCMGPVVQDMGHANGTCIYCHDLAKRCPRFMDHPDGHWAFDMVIKDELMPMLHDASHLMAHVWCMHGDLLLPYGSGTVPTFPTRNSMRYIPPSAVVLHRCKDSSLIQRLREQRTN